MEEKPRQPKYVYVCSICGKPLGTPVQYHEIKPNVYHSRCLNKRFPNATK